MVLLRQVDSPAAGASWTEHMYERPYKVVNGEVEVTHPNHIDLLLGRGFAIIKDEDKDKVVRALGVIRREDDPEPQGTQTVEAEDAPENVTTTEEEVVVPSTSTPPAPPVPQKRGRGRPKKNP